MLIKVKRSDGKIFTSDMANLECIIEIHFCTSYTQVIVQEENEDGGVYSKDIICPAAGTTPNPVDLIATYGDDTGKFI